MKATLLLSYKMNSYVANYTAMVVLVKLLSLGDTFFQKLIVHKTQFVGKSCRKAEKKKINIHYQ